MTCMNVSFKKPRAGIAIPLFSIRSERHRGGIGEILDLIPFIDFMAETGLSVLQLLPMNALAPGETSPYNALSAFAWDPIYLALDDWEDFQKSPAAQALCFSSASTDNRILTDCTAWDKSPTVDYEAIRAFKNNISRIVFKRFKTEAWEDPASSRANAFKTFMDKEASWLDDYALFRALYERFGQTAWTDWPKPFQKRYPLALSQFSKEAADELLFIKYLQWACWEQWKSVRAYAHAKNILLMGDIPFMVSQNSADVWGHQKVFQQADPGKTLGAPPDDFNPQGQKWGFPVFCWERMKKSNFAWWRARIQRADFDIIRLDHIVGFFRIWVFPKEGTPHFEPIDEASQRERGQLFLKVLLQEADSCSRWLVGEDLGVVPAFVQAEMNRLGIPGMKILRWQKRGDAFIPPRDYPALSLATTGTHDTSSLAGWWAEISSEERAGLLTALENPKNLSMEAGSLFHRIHSLIIRGLMEAGSTLVMFPFQDIFGSDEQINRPGTLSEQNWRYRMPVPIETLQNDPHNKNKIAFLKAAIARTGR